MSRISGHVARLRSARSSFFSGVRAAHVLAFLAVAFTLCAPLALRANAQSSTQIQSAGSSSNWAAPRTVFIPETGQSIDGVFLDQWRYNGGISVYGYPISPEVQENGHIVQYYQYARFEYVPEDPNGQVVHLGKLGLELRPQAVQRYSFPGVGVSTGQSSISTDMAKVTRAWLPLSSDTANRDNTDTWRFVEETDHSVSNGFKTYWEATGEAAYLGNPVSEEYVLSGVTYQVFEYGQLAWKPNADVWQTEIGETVAKKKGVSTAAQPQNDLPTYSEELFIPPPTPTPEPIAKPGGGNGERWVDVNLSAQYLVAYEGDTPVLETYVSTGREGFETPTGTFFVLTKIEAQTMEGVLGGEYYNVPDVPYVMYFTNEGHAIHGTYWHSNFGVPMSHGCINLPMDVAAWMYEWAPYGMRVQIHF